MINAGEYKHKIQIVKYVVIKDSDGFEVKTPVTVLSPYAKIKTTRGYTIIANNSDFEKAYTNFTIRYPVTVIDREMIILYKGKEYEIQYLNNIDELNVELEIQAKEVTH
jgi:SPP1 family predicted phage head-tail adaptor